MMMFQKAHIMGVLSNSLILNKTLSIHNDVLLHKSELCKKVTLNVS